MIRNYEIIQENCTGEVKWFNVEKGYGFIKPDDDNVGYTVIQMGQESSDVFFHVTATNTYPGDENKPQTGDKVEFDLACATERNKAVALNVTITEYRKATV